ncbi:hypothetical protein BDP27DRAFT_1318168 [Rhodocollybia butyracea]|uniref:Uncharacterized protein n=1 Tax=Rhodocollybia butyracea TaxID=206335 RepID=A0A9P5Q2W4_9AGAR|nr:hypothetical protein BDP27DRAFT_1318168 [Rhodocollybia butyracea]
MATEAMRPGQSPSSVPTTTQKRSRAEDGESILLPLSDQNASYYPSHGYDSDDEAELLTHRGNWGIKNTKGARFMRRGKITSWGPNMGDWDAEERTRKRIKLLLPQHRRSPSPPTLPHLSRSPSPPLLAPYPPPTTQHLTYSSFVMDKSVTHTFRSNLLDQLENATNGLIEGEATMRRAMGRLWQVMSEDPSPRLEPVTKQEDEELEELSEQDARAKRLARAPDLTPPIHKLFLFQYPNSSSLYSEQSHFTTPESQQGNLERAMAVMRELQDDGREYVERLQEIREGLGDIRAHRDGVWDMVRERAVQELQDAAFEAAVV